MENKKERLDVLIFKKNLVSSREKAKNAVLSGTVCVDGKTVLKPGMLVDENSIIIMKNCENLKYVSRGGLKLEKAIKSFQIDLHDLNCMDVGASTGGFTDCMIKNHCNIVYSVDVGRNQLDESLLKNPKVINLERTNIRNLCKDVFSHTIDFFTVDVSFISLELVLPSIKEIISPKGFGICLIKPQFEAGKDKVGKKGVVKDKKVHFEVVNKIVCFSISLGFSVLGLDYSPIKGPEGNIEYLIYLKKSDAPILNPGINIKEVVDLSHNDL